MAEKPTEIPKQGYSKKTKIRIIQRLKMPKPVLILKL